MKNKILIILLALSLVNCASHADKAKLIQKECPKCDYIQYNALDIAIDTSTTPNKIYSVSFSYNDTEVYRLEKIY